MSAKSNTKAHVGRFWMVHRSATSCIYIYIQKSVRIYQANRLREIEKGQLLKAAKGRDWVSPFDTID